MVLQPTQNHKIAIFIHSTLKDNWIHGIQPGTTDILSHISPNTWYNGPPLTNSLDDEQEIKRIQRLLVLHFHLKTLENNCNHPIQKLAVASLCLDEILYSNTSRMAPNLFGAGFFQDEEWDGAFGADDKGDLYVPIK